MNQKPKSQILIFVLTYPDSLPIIIYEVSGKKHQLDFELNAVLHFNFQIQVTMETVIFMTKL
jgi:hypothetical protein